MCEAQCECRGCIGLGCNDSTFIAADMRGILASPSLRGIYSLDSRVILDWLYQEKRQAFVLSIRDKKSK